MSSSSSVNLEPLWRQRSLLLKLKSCKIVLGLVFSVFYLNLIWKLTLLNLQPSFNTLLIVGHLSGYFCFEIWSSRNVVSIWNYQTICKNTKSTLIPRFTIKKFNSFFSLFFVMDYFFWNNKTLVHLFITCIMQFI